MEALGETITLSSISVGPGATPNYRHCRPPCQVQDMHPSVIWSIFMPQTLCMSGDCREAMASIDNHFCSESTTQSSTRAVSNRTVDLTDKIFVPGGRR